MIIWFYALISVFIVSLLSLVGVFTLSLRRELILKFVNFMVAFAVGALLGDAVLHLIPHAFEHLNHTSASLYILLGFFLFFALENYLHWRHCHHPTTKNHPHPVAILNLLGDGVHNFIDGLVIGVSYLVSIPVGIATTVAVVLHEIPQEVGDFGILVHSGLTVPRALFFNFVSALLAVVGTILALLIGPYVEGFSTILLPITAGGFIYIAGSDLIPTLHNKCDPKVRDSFLQFFFIMLGVLIMLALLVLE